MSGTGTGHDQSTDIFSAEGRVFQVEYACKAVDNSGTAVAACCRDGVVIAIEKIHASRMLENGSNNRIFAVDRQACVCICGMLPDGRAIVARAREEAENSRDIFATPILGSVLANRIGNFMHVFTTHHAYRPFGCAAIIASYADDGPQIYVSDPSGTVGGYYGIALGKAKTIAKSELEKIDFKTITCEEAVTRLANVIHDVHDKQKDKLYEVEVAWICDKSERKFQHVPSEMVPRSPE